MAHKYLSWPVAEMVPGEPLPATIYLFIEQRFIAYRGARDTLSRSLFDQLQRKRVEYLFIREPDRALFERWAAENASPMPTEEPSGSQLGQARKEVQRQMMDIFSSSHTNEVVAKTVEMSKNFVEEITKFPFAAKPLARLQNIAKGTVEHSVNVSALSVYLALNLGYSHVLILRHLAAGALLHDLGKDKVELNDTDSAEVVEKKMRLHPLLAEAMLEEESEISKEVGMIIAQHHEYHDGSGYPKGMHGSRIYDLAKIVTIANEFDELVADGKGTLAARQKHAIAQLTGPLAHRYDPIKLKKIQKVLELGI